MENAVIETEGATESRALFTIGTAALYEAVNYLSRRIARKSSTIRVLECVRIEARPDGALSVMASNLDQLATITLEADVQAPGIFCPDAATLRDALAKVKKAKCELVTIEEGESRAEIKAGRSRFKVTTRKADDFPAAPIVGIDVPLSAEFSCGAEQFGADIAALAPLMSKSESRYYICGIAMQRRTFAERDCLALVATDGSNMGAARRELPKGAENIPDIILPAGAVDALKWATKKPGEGERVDVAVSEKGDRLAFTIGALHIETKAIDGTYPDWQRVFEPGAALAPTGETGEALFPELFPGTPTGQMERIGKGVSAGAINWEPTTQGQLGSVAADPGLIFGCMNVKAEPKKGFSYEWTGHDQAKAYLIDLAEKRGLVTPDAMKARVEAYNESLGDDFAQYGTPYGKETPSRCVEFWGAKLARHGGRIVGLTIEAIETVHSYRETVKDWETLTEREVEHEGANHSFEGSYSILMPADGPQIEAAHTVTVEGDRTYPIAVNSSGAACHLSKDQVAALCGDELWNVIEFEGPDGKPRYVSKWLFDDGATRLLCVGKNGKCPKDGERREYVTREEVEAALAGEAIEPEPPQNAPELHEAEIGCPVAETVEIEASASEGEAGEPYGPPAPVPVDISADNSVSVAQSQEQPAIDPFADVLARLEAIEASLQSLSAKSVDTPSGEIQPRRRTAAHERAIRRAWAARARRHNYLQALNAANAYARKIEAEREVAFERTRELEAAMLNAANNQRDSNGEIMRLKTQIRTERRKRLSNAMLARKRTRDLVIVGNALHAEIDAVTAERDMAKAVPVYMDGQGREGLDYVTRSANHARTAIERAEMLEKALVAANQKNERLEAAVNRGADIIEEMGTRLANAEAAVRKLEAA